MEAADTIEETDLPPCVLEKNFNIARKNFLLFGFLGIMTLIGGLYSKEQSKGQYLTQRLRVEFDTKGLLARYNGCYSSSATIPKATNGNRFTYDYWDQEKDETFKFAYCKPKRQWVFFETTEAVNNDACKAIDEKKVMAVSSSTNAFDIADTFSNPWFSPGGTPLSMNFLQKTWSDEECAEFFADGMCYDPFNLLDFNYDGGDCCGATCPNSLCGVQKLDNAFGIDLKSVSDGFPTCVDPDMVDIVIKIDSIEKGEYMNQYGESASLTPPLLILECDDKLHLLLKLEDEMVGNNETVKVRDGASCKITVRKAIDLSKTDYQVYHRLDSGDEILILDGNNYDSKTLLFQVIFRCYFRKLTDHIEQDAIYSLKNSPSLAVRWLLSDQTGNSDCENPFFIERYALAVINYEAPAQNKTGEDGLWIETKRQCNWPNIVCDGGYIYEVIFNGYNVSGVIATEYGLLTNLTIISANYMSFTGTIPSELGSLTKLKALFLRGYKFNQNNPSTLSGPIPTELAKLSALEDFLLSSQTLSGTIPTELAQWKALKYLDLFDNDLTGTIPSELAEMSELRIIQLYDNLLNGTIPSELGGLSKLKSLALNGNFNSDRNELTGKIPSELGDLSSLESLDIRYLQFDDATIPASFAKLGELKELFIEGSNINGTIPKWLGNLSKLTKIEAGNNNLNGTIPTELGKLSELLEMKFFTNYLTGSLPTELGKLSKLQIMALVTNMLDGTIPTELGSMSALSQLDMRDNMLSGSIPTELGNLSQLFTLLLQLNALDGTIPAELGNLSSLGYLLLDDNELTGSIPPELGGLSAAIWIRLSGNALTGIVPPELGTLAVNGSLTEFHIDGTGIEGLHPLFCDNETDPFVFADFDECDCCVEGYGYYGYGYGYGGDNSTNTTGNATDDSYTSE